MRLTHFLHTIVALAGGCQQADLAPVSTAKAQPAVVDQGPVLPDAGPDVWPDTPDAWPDATDPAPEVACSCAELDELQRQLARCQERTPDAGPDIDEALARLIRVATGGANTDDEEVHRDNDDD